MFPRIVLLAFFALCAVPGRVFAQSLAPDTTETWLAPIALSPRGTGRERLTTHAARSGPTPPLTRATRIAFNVFTGTAFGTVGAILGAISGALVGALVSPACGYYTLGCVTSGLVIGAASASVAAIPFGLMLGGSRFEGRGAWLFTYVGTVIGAVLGFGVLALGQGSTASFVVGGALPVIGGIAAYELTSRATPTHAAHFQPWPRFVIAPAMLGNGAILGLGGAF